MRVLLAGRPLDAQVLATIRRAPRAQPITAVEVAVLVGTSERYVRRAVSALRRDGYPIGSTPHGDAGFYWPATLPEAEECSRHLWSRVREIAEVARAFDAAARGLGLQRELPEQVRLVFEEAIR